MFYSICFYICFIFLGIDILGVYQPLVNELIEAATEVYDLIENGEFTLYVGNDVYYVEGNSVQAIVQCPADGMVYDSFYCSK